MLIDYTLMFSKCNLTGHLFWCLLKPKLLYYFEQKLQILSLIAFGLYTVAVDVGFYDRLSMIGANGTWSASFPESKWASSKVKAEAETVKVETVAVDSSSSELELSISDLDLGINLYILTIL